MKKCASCTKDLPDAALHCVFCGAKQAPAPAVQPGLAKTAFGYSANELLEQARRTGAPPAAPRTAPAPVPPMPTMPQPPAGIGTMPTMLPNMPPPRTSAPPPMAPSPPPYAPPQPSPYAPPQPSPYAPPAGPPYAAGPQSNFVPSSAASAKTMFVQAAPAPPPARAELPAAARRWPRRWSRRRRRASR